VFLLSLDTESEPNQSIKNFERSNSSELFDRYNRWYLSDPIQSKEEEQVQRIKMCLEKRLIVEKETNKQGLEATSF
jgi:hypothetical protein